MNWPKIALFGSGLFAGGAIDHAILGMIGSSVTPYGIRCGVAGNWLFASIEAVVAVGLFWLHRRERRTARS